MRILLNRGATRQPLPGQAAPLGLSPVLGTPTLPVARTLAAVPLKRVALMMAGSGFAGLAYQIIWTQQLGAWLGHEIVSVLAVVAAFFGGLALGAWALGRRVARSRNPARWYAACEATIGLYGLVLSGLLPAAGAALAGWIGAEPTALWHWTVAFAGPGLLLLPATMAMGAALPAADALLQRAAAGPLSADGFCPASSQPAPARTLALLYAANTGGGVVGVLAAAFVLVPAWGLARSAWLCAAINLACAAWVLARWAAPAATRTGPPLATPASVPAALAAPALMPKPARQVAAEQRQLLRLAGATGLLGIGYEVVVVRVLSQVAEDTVYTFALLLAVYLVGAAVGAALHHAGYPALLRRSAMGRVKGAVVVGTGGAMAARVDADAGAGRHAGRHAGHDVNLFTLRALLVALALACLVGTLALSQADALMAALLAAGDGRAAHALAAEALLALAAFGLPTLVMGALFSHLATVASAGGLALGPVLASNTLGAALAPLLFGVLAVPKLGPKAALLLIVVGYLLCCLPGGRRLKNGARFGRPPWQRGLPRRLMVPLLVVGGATVAGTAWVALHLPPLMFVTVPEGGHLHSYHEGLRAAVSVVADDAGVLRLRIDNRAQEGSSASLLSDARQAWLPLLLHPAPQRVLLLGLGTGTTARAAAQDPRLQVQAVELLPEVVQAAAAFAPAYAQAAGLPGPPPTGVVAQPTAALSGPAPLITVADARRFVRTSAQHYDVVVADLFHPARSGAGALYTVEHFAAIRSRLAPGGLFCQWLPLHQLDLATLQSITRSYLAVYPGAVALLATNSLDTPVLGLLSRPDAPQWWWPDLARRLDTATTAPAMARRLAQWQLSDPWAVAGSLVAGPLTLSRWAGRAPLNTDDHPVVAHRAPWATYAPEATPRQRLQSLLALWQPGLADLPAQVLADVPADLPAPAGGDAVKLQNATAPGRLLAYWQARNRFIEAGMAVRPSADASAMLAQVQAPLLAIVQASPEFRPAYDPLLAMAQALASQDPPRAMALLGALAQANPGRPEAARLLQGLVGQAPPTAAPQSALSASAQAVR